MHKREDRHTRQQCSFRAWLLDPVLSEIRRMEENIMSKISEFAARQAERNAAIAASLDGVVSDIQALSDKITELQNTAGAITPEDQALLDEAEVMAQTLADRVRAVDEQNPAPTPPPE